LLKNFLIIFRTMARRLLILKRNQLIPCSFVLKDFAGISFGYRFFLRRASGNSHPVTGKIGRAVLREHFSGLCGTSPEPSDGKFFWESKDIESRQKPGSPAKAMV
jgi:hypothetical protein